MASYTFPQIPGRWGGSGQIQLKPDLSPADLRRAAFGVGITAIIPGELLVGDPRVWLLGPLNKAATPVKQQLRLTTATWEEHKVNFAHRRVFPRGATGEDDVGVIIYPIGDEESVRIWHYLNGGTKERWAVMSSQPPWISKTQPGRLIPGPGQGYVYLKGMGQMQRSGYNQPQEGIEARGWTDLPQVWGPGQKALERGIVEAMINAATGSKSGKIAPNVPFGFTKESYIELAQMRLADI